ncbi:MAG: hypothetical protein CVU05_11190 [Bacteroidetes bacterium HGW-Bacteroidetes-21]|nr:MAG: hypothetical protein CVU05_11190 [Bacteroidetes bacterium HGW-Bacteroidetes-21]
MQRILSIVFFLVFIVNVLSAQDIRKDFEDAEYYFMYEEFSEALPIYLDILKMDPDNCQINYRVGLCLMYSSNPKDKETALPYFEKSTKDINPNYKEGNYRERRAPSDSYFYLGNVYRYALDFDKALVAYEKFLSLLPVKDVFYIDYVKREIEATKNAKELVNFPVKVQIENLGEKINSPTSVENCPVVSYDENTLVFTSGKKNIFSPDIDINVVNQDYEMDQIYFSQRRDGKWTDPRNITKELGATKRAVPVTINADGTELYLVQDDNDNGNIYVSHFKNEKWSSMKKLNGNINTKHWESHASLTRDGKTLYFTSDRSGGYGGLDIYISSRDEDGEWGPAVNIGTTINTPWDEETPFILGDDKTLYFSSQGHYGMGGLDVFHTTKLSEGVYSSPLNLGYPINTVGNDLFYLPKANGEYAFFPLNNNERGIGKNDIYKISISIPDGHVAEIQLKGIISTQDQRSELPSDFIVAVIDSLTGDTLSKVKPNFVTGEYSTIIQNGNFKIEYKCTGYLSHYERLFIPDVYTRSEIVVNVEMIPLEVSKGEYYVIRNIFFDYGKDELRRESMIELERLASLMTKNPFLYVEIIGHTDAKGSSDFNKKLSERRAKSSIDYLVSLGIERNRFIGKGMGKSHFIAINDNPDGSDNPEGRQLNRRVEIKLMNSDITNIIVEEIKVPEQLMYTPDCRRKSNDTYTILAQKSKVKLSAEKSVGYTETVSGNEYFYTKGTYNQKSDAIKELNLVIDAGFIDASIISMNELGYQQKDIENTFNASQNDSVTETNAEYTIQLKALIKPADAGAFSGVKGVKENYSSDGFYRYVVGDFETREEAQEECKRLIETGFTDAFVTSLSKHYAKVKTKGEFTIQLKSVSRPVDIKLFSSLKGVQEKIGNDGQYKYIYGYFESIDDARKEIKKVQKAGFQDAFVVSMSKFK